MTGRVNLQPAFVLHRRPYGDTSLLVELFTLEYGRVGGIAKGARRPRSRLTAAGHAFRPLLVSWSGRGELPSVTAAEAQGGGHWLTGEALLCGFYLNELVLKLVVRHDPHPPLFQAYQAALEPIAAGVDPQIPLRLFEKRLLDALGYGLLLGEEAETGAAVVPTQDYHYLPEQGPVPAASVTRGQGVTVSGAALLALGREQLDDAALLREIKQLLAANLARYLGGRALHSRRLYRQMPMSKQGSGQ